jgi:glutaminyl-peptide cyclotransferase
MNKLKWQVELDSFNDVTPDRRKLPFTNIIATYKPDAPQLLVLSCHYDSKLSNFVFIGATDSAVPCGMLLYLAKNLDSTLRNLQLVSVGMKNDRDEDTPDKALYSHSFSLQTVGLQLIFFDGEEAFVNWTPRDSLYGARHLATTMAAKTFDASRKINHIHRMVSCNEIRRNGKRRS